DPRITGVDGCGGRAISQAAAILFFTDQGLRVHGRRVTGHCQPDWPVGGTDRARCHRMACPPWRCARVGRGTEGCAICPGKCSRTGGRSGPQPGAQTSYVGCRGPADNWPGWIPGEATIVVQSRRVELNVRATNIIQTASEHLANLPLLLATGSAASRLDPQFPRGAAG